MARLAMHSRREIRTYNFPQNRVTDHEHGIPWWTKEWYAGIDGHRILLRRNA